jgi:predicted acyltransferase
MTVTDPTVAKSSPETRPARLLSLDVFRGLVILSMLVVNNLGDYGSTGYFWKHADWPEPWLGEAFRQWWANPDPRHFPLLTHCTLADYVMPSFMLIIGLAVPYSVASIVKRGVPARVMWVRTVKRAAMLVVLGWVLCYFRDQFAASLYGKKPWAVSLGMDVLQLLGVAYLVARVGYELPRWPRLGVAVGLLVWHWAFLRFWPQGEVAAGTFTAKQNAVGYAYANWGFFQAWQVVPGRVTVSWAGLLSVPPAVGTMLLGTLAGDLIRRTDLSDRVKVRRLLVAGVVMAMVGAVWAFDLPFNKPRWTPSYLLWVAGVDLVILAALYQWVDVRGSRWWTYPLVVFGSNAIAAYFLSIMAKVLLLNTPRVTYGGETMALINAVMLVPKGAMGPRLGGWTFTVAFVAVWWVILDWMYRRKWFWKV